MKLVIHTQYKENYAAHNEDYVHGVSDTYWKFKGGDTYVIERLTNIDGVASIKATVDSVRDLIEYEGEASMEYILDWVIMDDAEEVCESWETPIILFRELDGWEATKVTDNRVDGWMRSEILEKRERWTMLPSDRKDYMSTFVMNDGQIVDYKDLAQWFKKAA